MKPRVAAAIRPNEGIQADYRLRLATMIAQMHNSVIYWLQAAYRAKPPEMAMDASPASTLRKLLQELAGRWQKRFDDLAVDLAKHFAIAAHKRADGALKSILKKHGIAVRFNLSREVNDVLQATIGENVSLIKSISSQYFTQVEGAVMRSVTAGRDLASLVTMLGPKVDLARIGMGQKPGESDKSFFARTWRRASFIALDQNNKATAMISRTRQTSLGITENVWLHSGAGKHPRPEHVAFSGRRFKLSQGAYLEKKWVWPGTEPGCRCVSKPVIPGLDFRPRGIARPRLAMDKGTWIEWKHPRDAEGKFVSISGGHTKPTEGTVGASVWKIADTISNSKEGYATTKEVVAQAVAAGINKASAELYFHRWEKFYGIKAPKVPKGPKAKPASTETEQLQKFVEKYAAPPPPDPTPVEAELSSEQKLEIVKKGLAAKGIDPEGVYGDIHYFKTGSSKVSYKPDTGTWRISKKIDGVWENITTGEGALNLIKAIEAGVIKGYKQKKTADQPTEPVEKGKIKFHAKGAVMPHALPEDIISSLKSYTGAGYKYMNTAMRGGHPPPPVDKYIQKHILNIQKAFASISPIKKAMRAYRGISGSALGKMAKEAGLSGIDDIQPGHVLVDKGFISTSHKPNTTWGSLVMDITAPPGTKAIRLQPISNHKHEDETLLQDGTKFKITAVDKDPNSGHVKRLHVEVVL